MSTRLPIPVSLGHRISSIQWYMVGTWSVHGRYMVGTWSVHGRYMVGTWSAHGRYMVGTWSVHGRYMVGTWSVHGRYMVGTWSVHGRCMCRYMVGTFHRYLEVSARRFLDVGCIFSVAETSQTGTLDLSSDIGFVKEALRFPAIHHPSLMTAIERRGFGRWIVERFLQSIG